VDLLTLFSEYTTWTTSERVIECEALIRADERARIVAWLKREADEYDKVERASGKLRGQSAAGTLAYAADQIEKGLQP
jgi:hypothetical protein